MRKVLFEISQYISVGRWIALFVLLALCMQSVLLPLELVHSHPLAIMSVRGCAVLLVRESDIFVLRAWLPYPLFVAVVLLHPILAWRRVRRAGSRF